MELVPPSIAYKKSFIEAVREYQQEDAHGAHMRDTHYKNLDTKELEQDFENYVARILSHSEGKNQKEGYVPESTLWLVDKDEFIGRFSIRHTLTDKLHREGGHIGYDIRPSKRGQGYGKKILELGIIEAKKMGFNNLLITCDVNNIPSKKIIKANGGKLESTVKMDEGKPDKARYWIAIK